MQRFEGRLSRQIDPAAVQTEWNFLARRNSFPPTDLVFRGDMVVIRVHNSDTDPKWPIDDVRRYFTTVMNMCDKRCELHDFTEVA